MRVSASRHKHDTKRYTYIHTRHAAEKCYRARLQKAFALAATRLRRLPYMLRCETESTWRGRRFA